MKLECSNISIVQHKLVGSNHDEMNFIFKQLIYSNKHTKGLKRGPKSHWRGSRDIKSTILRRIMQLKCSNFCDVQYKLVSSKYNKVNPISMTLLDSSTYKRSNYGPKTKLKWVKISKIENIEENNAYGMLKYLHCVA